ncbi:hypothetical protein KIPB_011126, partial [Kipferlia bialata]
VMSMEIASPSSGSPLDPPPDAAQTDLDPSAIAKVESLLRLRYPVSTQGRLIAQGRFYLERGTFIAIYLLGDDVTAHPCRIAALDGVIERLRGERRPYHRDRILMDLDTHLTAVTAEQVRPRHDALHLPPASCFVKAVYPCADTMRCPLVRSALLHPLVTDRFLYAMLRAPERCFFQSDRISGTSTAGQEFVHRVSSPFGLLDTTAVGLYIGFVATRAGQVLELVRSVLFGGVYEAVRLWERDNPDDVSVREARDLLTLVSSIATRYRLVHVPFNESIIGIAPTDEHFLEILDLISKIWRGVKRRPHHLQPTSRPAIGLPRLYVILDEAGGLVDGGSRTIKDQYAGTALGDLLQQGQTTGTFGSPTNTTVIVCGSTNLASVAYTCRSIYIHNGLSSDETYALFCFYCHLAGAEPDKLLSSHLGLSLDLPQDQEAGYYTADKGREAIHALTSGIPGYVWAAVVATLVRKLRKYCLPKDPEADASVRMIRDRAIMDKDKHLWGWLARCIGLYHLKDGQNSLRFLKRDSVDRGKRMRDRISSLFCRSAPSGIPPCATRVTVEYTTQADTAGVTTGRLSYFNSPVGQTLITLSSTSFRHFDCVLVDWNSTTLYMIKISVADDPWAEHTLPQRYPDSMPRVWVDDRVQRFFDTLEQSRVDV